MLGKGTRKSFLVSTRPQFILTGIWSPSLKKNIDALERVQRRASKYAPPMLSRDSPYEERAGKKD